jgi:hypothetical protein
MTYIRKCPECNKKIKYKNLISFNNAKNKNSKCASCRSNWREYNKTHENAFKNKNHSDITKKQISKSRLENGFDYQSPEFRQTMSNITSGEKNGMFGKTIKDTWIEKYGKEEAEIRYKNWKTNISKAIKGDKNPMYGKPSPQGSGNGWCGWYKGWFFRSLKELSYMIYVIERFNLKWETGEKRKFRIEYIDYTGNKRTYHPDFFINDKFLVEIKPKMLWKSDSVQRKQEAAIEFCKEHSFIYKLTESTKLLKLKEIKQLIKEEKLIFTKRYQEKFNKL